MDQQMELRKEELVSEFYELHEELDFCQDLETRMRKAARLAVVEKELRTMGINPADLNTD